MSEGSYNSASCFEVVCWVVVIIIILVIIISSLVMIGNIEPNVGF